MTEREEFDQWYAENAFDYERDPIGSRDCGLQRKAYHAGKQAGRDEVLKELSEKEPVGWIEHHKAGDNIGWEEIEHSYARPTPLIIRPSPKP